MPQTKGPDGKLQRWGVVVEGLPGIHDITLDGREAAERSAALWRENGALVEVIPVNMLTRLQRQLADEAREEKAEQRCRQNVHETIGRLLQAATNAAIGLDSKSALDVREQLEHEIEFATAITRAGAVWLAVTRDEVSIVCRTRSEAIQTLVDAAASLTCGKVSG
jgi:hypothetical protein